MKIHNYGEYEKSRLRGYHPPACTCYRCNEAKAAALASEAEDKAVAEYDRRTGRENTERVERALGLKPLRPAEETSTAQTQPAAPGSSDQDDKSGRVKFVFLLIGIAIVTVAVIVL